MIIRSAIFLLVTTIFLLSGCGEKKAPPPSGENTAKEKVIKVAETKEKTGMIPVKGTNLFTKITGEGSPVIVIHGGPGLHHEYLYDHLKPLARDYRMIFYDQRGTGKSDPAGDSATMTMNRFTDDIEDLRQGLKEESVTLMAHSWGSLIALNYAIKYPNRVEKLILIDPSAGSATDAAAANKELAKRFTPEDIEKSRRIRASEAFRNKDPRAVEELMKIGFRHQFNNKKALNQLNLGIDTGFFRTSQNLKYLGSYMTTYNLLPELKKITAPTLIIYGEEDPLTPVSANKYQKNIPEARLIIFPKSGHFPFIEAKDNFYRVVREFMNKD